jgi:hypothetical protein
MDALLASVLYLLCGGLLASAALFLVLRQERKASTGWFVATCLTLLIWVVTLYLFRHSKSPDYILLIGRINFAAISLAVYMGYRFVRSVAGLPTRWNETALLGVSVILAFITTATPLVDEAERLSANLSSHETVYGPLFPLYLVHVIALVGASLVMAFRQSRQKQGAGDRPSVRSTRDQLLLIGGGILATTLLSLVTNVALPYLWRNFDWIDVGPISTLLFLLAVAYAVVRHQLFDIRVFLRKTLVLGIALSLVLAVYSAIVLLVTDRFASSESSGVTRFGVLVIAFSFDPIRRLLEEKIDKLLKKKE